MRVSRRFLYWGVFLVAMGGVLVASDLKAIDVSGLEQTLRFWPLAIIAIGLAIVVRRSRANAAAWVAAAALPGLFLGSAFAVIPEVAIGCGSGTPASFARNEGTFTGPATITVTSGCGSLTVGTAAGNSWRLESGSTDAAAADVTATATSLAVRSGRAGDWLGLGGRDVWRLTVPTAPVDRLELDVNAGEGTVDLAGAQVGTLALKANAARATADLSAASIGQLSATVNAGSLSISLPGGADMSATIEANAGRLDLCIPPGLGVQVEQQSTLGSTTYRGVTQDGPTWQTPDYGTAAHRADLTVRVNLGTVQIDPIGGCQ